MAEKKTQEDPNGVVNNAPDVIEFDTAGKSLTEALGVSFGILKVIMIVLVIVFVCSGIFRVQENEQAFVLRLGKIRDTKLLGPGLQFGFPEPIDEIVRIPVTKVQTLNIDSLWYYETPQEKVSNISGRPGKTLNPVRDGYCLTRNDSITNEDGNDYNIVHSKWKLTYVIDRPQRFFRNIFYRPLRPGEDFLDVAGETVNPLLESMAADSIVTTMVNYSIEEAIVSKSMIADDVERLLQEKLDRIESGITVVAMQVSGKITWPRQVDLAFQLSNKASQKKDEVKRAARGYAEKVLSETGGPRASEILVALKEDDITEEQSQRLLSRLSGECQGIIADARAYRTRTVETAKANADYLTQLLPEYKQRPQLVLQDIYQNAIKDVMANAEEKIFIQPSVSGKPREIRIMVNRDPAIGKGAKKQEN